MQREIDGERIHTEQDFHMEIGRVLELGPHYGRNLDALWDRLSTDIERPLTLVWKNAAVSRQHMGEPFDAIVAVLRRVEAQDEHWKLAERFSYVQR